MSKEIVKEEAPSSSPIVSGSFASLRSVRWRISLGILPSSSSVDDLRRVTADSRRRYAGLRRWLLVDPHVPKDGRSKSPDLVMDNPLSQNPVPQKGGKSLCLLFHPILVDWLVGWLVLKPGLGTYSTWGRFFRNAELEKMVDQDLSRLYPEHGSYFQTPGCQGMLRRILLLWCLRHPEYGYRQGMHELLAPLLYVLHVDVERLSEVRKLHEHHFIDKFDGLSFEENDVTYNFDFKKLLDSIEDEIGSQGELGIVLSEKFTEHDAYCMFEALMSGAHGSVAMADFFSPIPAAESQSGLPPVIEASAALYHLLSIVDSSLHSHLVELGVEPQYFALRWLRVLFGREFSLQDLLVVWDEIFTADNSPLEKDFGNDENSSFKMFNSCRGALITAMAVSMILYVRSSLLATENATTCLQRLLNFPETINLKKLIAKAKPLQILALDSKISPLSSIFDGSYNRSKSAVSGYNFSSHPVSPETPLSLVPDSYWEEKWRVLHKAEELKQESLDKLSPSGKKRWSEKVKLVLSRTGSDPSPARAEKYKKGHKSSVRRSLLDDLTRQLGLEEEDTEKGGCSDASNLEDHHSTEAQVEGQQNDTNIGSIYGAEERCECGSGTFVSEENSSIFSDPLSSGSGTNDHENDTEKSSVASNLSSDENDDHHQSNPEDSPLPVSSPPPEGVPLNSPHENESSGKLVSAMKERRHLSGRFQWLLRFGRNNVSQEASDKGGGTNETAKSLNRYSKSNTADSSITGASRNSSLASQRDVVDQNVMGTLKNLGQSMLEHIQVLESVFQQDRVQVGSVDNLGKNNLVGKGQVTAMTALKELRKISNLLSEISSCHIHMPDRRPAFDGDGWLRASDGMVELSEVEDVCSLIR
ncbi:Ypt/Rab-GAP domain of gyp1p superfamily protein isoform 1 [Gossypium australe]|uniref:Ypt/Rab-GAP domain of gyp1p superfamily protein isoform 1 n=1 Tax=Gossypium australe TaxID=47621 RepID=A0A5B6VPA2_9ROSI|nr:Ypt/Rab-GAP domain of gyp1p superfamily protein isoform 1 [Gossypium australe]